MSEQNSTASQNPQIGTTDQATIDGAKRCLEALAALEHESKNTPDEVDGFYQAQERAGIALADAIGPMPEHVRGAIRALGEFIHTYHVAGEPNLEQWRPCAAMTEAERTAQVRETERSLAEH